MRDNFIKTMYLRPGNLWKDFLIYRKRSGVSPEGLPVSGYEKAGMIRGILAEASNDQNELKKHLWDQDQHTLTHTMITYGAAPVKKGDKLVLGERNFFVLLNDDIGSLGISGNVYLEERNDIK